MGKREIADLFSDDKKGRVANHRLDDAHYSIVPNPDNDKGYWRIHGDRLNCYAQSALAPTERLAAVRDMIAWECGAPEPSEVADDFSELGE